jgi:hypothetical protein
VGVAVAAIILSLLPNVTSRQQLSFTIAQQQQLEDTPYIAAGRNFTDVQHESLRLELDGKYNALHDELSATYYDYWKKGLSFPWQGYDAQPTLEQSKALFDKLHGLIWHHYEVEFHQLNLSKPLLERIPEEEYNDTVDDLGRTVKRDQLAQSKIDQLALESITITIDEPKVTTK